jgi:hypothetical protein
MLVIAAASRVEFLGQYPHRLRGRALPLEKWATGFRWLRALTYTRLPPTSRSACKVIRTDGRTVASFNTSPDSAMRYTLVQIAESEGGDAADYGAKIDEALAEMRQPWAGSRP